ncbi:MAG: amidase family protein [Firmicutes bacterium]|nr:amidase family protein [Bacillota bacterium]
MLKDHDVIYLPAAPGVAPKFSESGDRLSDQYLIADNHLVLGNFAGLPSITLPIGFENKMPFGGNVMGRAFEEALVLQVAQKIEESTGYRNLSAKAVTL